MRLEDKTLLSPTMNPGDLVKVESRYVVGWMKVKSAHHTGDTHSSEWCSELDLVDRNATLQAPEGSAAERTGVYGGVNNVGSNMDIGCQAVLDSGGGTSRMVACTKSQERARTILRS